MIIVPKRICPKCDEFLPHACAPVVTITRQRGGNVELGKASAKVIRIVDR